MVWYGSNKSESCESNTQKSQTQMAPHAAFKNRKSRNAVESMALTAEVHVSYDCCIFKTEQIFQNSVKFNAMQSS